MRLLKEVRNLMGNYHVKSGIYHYYRNEFKQAVDFFHKALKDEANLTDSEHRTARYYLTHALLDRAARLEAKGEREDAAREYQRAVEVSPEYPDVRLALGRVLERLGRPGDAIAAYRHAVDRNPRFVEAWTALGFCLLRARRQEEAGEAFARSLDLRIQALRAPYERGVSELRAGNTAGAEEQFRLAFVRVPHLFQEHYRNALEHLKTEEFEEALGELDRALEHNPGYPDLHNFRGVALYELGRVEDAIPAFRHSVTLAPDYLIARLNLAFALFRDGRFKEAEDELEKVVEQDPTEPAAKAKLEELRTGRAPENRRGVSRGGGR